VLRPHKHSVIPTYAFACAGAAIKKV
jgi:hypothetical protein